MVEHRQAALLPNTLDDPRWLPRPWERPNSHSRSAVSVPLSLFERPIGVITLLTDAEAQFSQNDLALLSTIAVGLSLSAAGFILPPSVPVEPPSSINKRNANLPLEIPGVRPMVSSAGPRRLS